MSKNILEVKELKTFYKTRLKEKVFAVDGVSFNLEEGKTLGIYFVPSTSKIYIYRFCYFSSHFHQAKLF